MKMVSPYKRPEATTTQISGPRGKTSKALKNARLRAEASERAREWAKNHLGSSRKLPSTEPVTVSSSGENARLRVEASERAREWAKNHLGSSRVLPSSEPVTVSSNDVITIDSSSDEEENSGASDDLAEKVRRASSQSLFRCIDPRPFLRSDAASLSPECDCLLANSRARNISHKDATESESKSSGVCQRAGKE